MWVLQGHVGVVQYSGLTVRTLGIAYSDCRLHKAAAVCVCP
jgi:hypothetical protein